MIRAIACSKTSAGCESTGLFCAAPLGPAAAAAAAVATSAAADAAVVRLFLFLVHS